MKDKCYHLVELVFIVQGVTSALCNYGDLLVSFVATLENCNGMRCPNLIATKQEKQSMIDFTLSVARSKSKTQQRRELLSVGNNHILSILDDNEFAPRVSNLDRKFSQSMASFITGKLLSCVFFYVGTSTGLQANWQQNQAYGLSRLVQYIFYAPFFFWQARTNTFSSLSGITESLWVFWVSCRESSDLVYSFRTQMDMLTNVNFATLVLLINIGDERPAPILLSFVSCIVKQFCNLLCVKHVVKQITILLLEVFGTLLWIWISYQASTAKMLVMQDCGIYTEVCVRRRMQIEKRLSHCRIWSQGWISTDFLLQRNSMSM